MSENRGDRAWTAWSQARPTRAGVYWWRLPAAVIGGMELRPEWVEEVSLHGMGFGESELWPVFSSWDGYQRRIPNGVEWSLAEAGLKPPHHHIPMDGLKPCPFCAGKAIQ